ncbi:ectopic P granules protein 5 [Caerostris extrusa]|uniref:Ectopic P granules protein 5 n=1 Tax=Caerostris extrusa TaxID=172846 RepID=A0AAV4S354_CAEEX|nr:ectopic P granules protein 5 [Caerostris extrusa]
MSLNDETELCKNDFILKIKESSSVFKENKVLLDNMKTLSGFDEKTEVKNVYPNLKSIQHCEKIEDIESMRTIVQTYSEEYTSKTYNEAVKGCQKFQLEVAGIENHILFALGLCEDGSTVSVSKKYCVKELDKTNFYQVIKLLGELDEIVLSNNFRSYSVGLSKMKIEQYIYNMISSIKSTENPNFENFSEFRSNEYIKMH